MISRSSKSLVTILKSLRTSRPESISSCKAWFTTSLEITYFKRPLLWLEMSLLEKRFWWSLSLCHLLSCRWNMDKRSLLNFRRLILKSLATPQQLKTLTWSLKAQASHRTTLGLTSLKGLTTQCTLSTSTSREKTSCQGKEHKNNILSNKTQQCKTKCKTNIKTLNSTWTALPSNRRSKTPSLRATKKTIQWGCHGSSSNLWITPWAPNDLLNVK